MNHRGLKAAVSCAKARESRSIYAVRKITSPWLMHHGSCTNSKATLLELKHEVSLR